MLLKNLGVVGIALVAFLSGCGSGTTVEPEAEVEALSRTEFTDRIENFFEYEPLKVGRASHFLIHLTDLSDGTPVEKAEVALRIQKVDSGEITNVKAKVGRVTGIYVADVELPAAGKYNITFRVTNEKIDETMPLTNFEVE